MILTENFFTNNNLNTYRDTEQSDDLLVRCQRPASHGHCWSLRSSSGHGSAKLWVRGLRSELYTDLGVRTGQSLVARSQDCHSRGFGSTATTSAPTFGGFGQTTQASAAPTFGGFGQTTQPSAAPTFGGFGTTATTSAPAFGGFGSTATTSAPTFGGFGSTATTSAPTFGGFGQTAQTSTAPTFGGFGSTATTSAPTFGGFGQEIV